MVKMSRYALGLVLVIAFAMPVFAQDDYPKFELAPGYGNIGLKKLVGSGRHSGFTLGTDYNFTDKLGVELFTGYYNIASGATLYTNTIGVTAAYRKNSRIVPYGTGGFGFGNISTSSGSGKAMATRIGGGVDIPFKDSMAIRVEATRMGFHFFKTWESGVNYSVGIVLNLSQ